MFLDFFLLHLQSVALTLSPIAVYLKQLCSRMSPSKDCQDRKFHTNSSQDSYSKLSRKDRQVTKKMKPPNAFLLYRSEKLHTLRGRMNAPLPHDISRLVALWWHETTHETKEHYRLLSNIKAARYDPRFPLIFKEKSCLTNKHV
jgi:HMG (high mobility group) box